MKLYPSVGMKKQPTVHLVANFGQQPFIFDIDGMVQVCKQPFKKENHFFDELATDSSVERKSVGVFGH